MQYKTAVLAVFLVMGSMTVYGPPGSQPTNRLAVVLTPDLSVNWTLVNQTCSQLIFGIWPQVNQTIDARMNWTAINQTIDERIPPYNETLVNASIDARAAAGSTNWTQVNQTVIGLMGFPVYNSSGYIVTLNQSVSLNDTWMNSTIDLRLGPMQANVTALQANVTALTSATAGRLLFQYSGSKFMMKVT